MNGGDARDAPRYARPFALVFLAALVVCALGGWNLWPFSSWELFSRLRTDRQTGWEALSVTDSGQVRAYPLATLPDGYRGFAATLARFPADSVASRDATCTDWLHDASRRLGPVWLVRIYRVEWVLSDRRGGHAAPRHLALAWTCKANGAHAAS